METDSAQRRLQKWLQAIVNTQDAEVDCDALNGMLEELVAIGSREDDISLLLPDVALHLQHCPECGEWYEVLQAMVRQPE
jgi:hypothetical protein